MNQIRLQNPGGAGGGWESFSRMLESNAGKELGREALETIKEIFKPSRKDDYPDEGDETFNEYKSLPPTKARPKKPIKDYAPLKILVRFIENNGDPSAYLETMSISYPDYPFCQTLITCGSADQLLVSQGFQRHRSGHQQVAGRQSQPCASSWPRPPGVPSMQSRQPTRSYPKSSSTISWSHHPGLHAVEEQLDVINDQLNGLDRMIGGHSVLEGGYRWWFGSRLLSLYSGFDRGITGASVAVVEESTIEIYTVLLMLHLQHNIRACRRLDNVMEDEQGQASMQGRRRSQKI